ncbi:hypothetical protein ACWIGI_28550 [Nocardia sp. NPDC055321]
MNLDLEHEADQFRNHALANGRTQVDWSAAFHTWLGRAKPRPTAISGSADYARPKLAASDRKALEQDAIFDELRRRNAVSTQPPLVQIVDAQPLELEAQDWTATA